MMLALLNELNNKGEKNDAEWFRSQQNCPIWFVFCPLFSKN